MKKYFLLLIAVFFFAWGCTPPEPLEEVQDTELLRMPFNERVFLLNNVSGESRIYELDYDFQGLGDEADLNRFMTDTPIPSGGHMTISPDKQWITIVISKRSKIYLVNINDGSVKELELLTHDTNGIGSDKLAHKNENKFKGSITQVDVDEEGYLFLAGKAGFFKVVADNGNGQTDPSAVNGGSDIWYDTDPTIQSVAPGETWVHAVKFEFSGDAYVETTDDGEDYFEDATPFNPKRVKFIGGDILFTQNSTETDGFEQQRLLSFSQWKGNTAIALDLNWDWDNQTVNFTAGQVFGGNKNSPFNRRNKTLDNAGTERVTGAALTGDNFVFTSHHKRNYVNLWNLHGDHIAKVTFNFPGEKFKNNSELHNWGDMTSTQAFDKNTKNNEDASLSSKEIDGQYYDEWYRGDFENHQYAEVKLYRPGAGMQKDPNNMSDEDYNSTKESRPNAANADIADYRKNAAKFASLGKEGGYMLLRFQDAVDVTSSTMLQVVETSWNRAASYANLNDARSAYPEEANVFVLKSNASPRYYIKDLEKHVGNPAGEWVYVGKAGIAGNDFPLYDIAASSAGAGDRDRLVGESVQWVMIRDKTTRTPDGFDVNFVSVYEEEITCGDDISEANFTTSYDPNTNEIVVNWDFTAADLGIRDNGGIQIWVKNGRQFDGNRDQIGRDFWSAEAINTQELRISLDDFNYSGDDCIQNISFSFHTICDRTSDGWIRGNVFSMPSKTLEIAGEYCPDPEADAKAALCEGGEGTIVDVTSFYFAPARLTNGEFTTSSLDGTNAFQVVNGTSTDAVYVFDFAGGATLVVPVAANSAVYALGPMGTVVNGGRNAYDAADFVDVNNRGTLLAAKSGTITANNSACDN
jgi:hypothetical protein